MGEDYWTGTVFTTNRRVWEHDDKFKKYLRKVRAMAIDMETATIFITAFKNSIPAGALLLVSDQPMVPEGVKTSKSDEKVTKHYVDLHLEIGINSSSEMFFIMFIDFIELSHFFLLYFTQNQKRH